MREARPVTRYELLRTSEQCNERKVNRGGTDSPILLEPRNMEESFQDLKKHLATLLDARRNIEKAEEQIKLLQPDRKSLV